MNEKRFVGPFAEYFTALVEEKRAQGYAYTERTRLLHTLDRMSLDYDCSGGLPKQLVLDYVTRQPHWSQATQESRVYTAHIAAVYLSRHGIRHTSPHVLRHTKAMHMVEAGINPIYIRDVLGHADLKTTDIYAKTSTELKRTALAKLDPGVLPASSATWNEDRSLMAWLTSLGK